MVSLQDFKAWLSSDAYNRLLMFVAKEASLNIDFDELPEVLFEYDLSDTNAAGVSIEDLKNIALEKELCVRYVVEKLVSMDGTENEQEGRHEEDEDDVVLEDGLFPKDFLNGYLLEIYLLRLEADALDRYLKQIRIPHSKKYAAQLREVYRKVSGTKEG